MQQNYKTYPFGFLLSTQEYLSVPEYYDHKLLLENYHYYFDPHHGFNYYENNNSFVLIHGHYQHVSVDSSPYKNNELLTHLLNLYYTDYTAFLNILDFIGGRYCIIIGDKNNLEVYQDASGARSVYYTLDNNIISSHANLIKQVNECEPFKHGTKSTYPRFSFDNSPYENVKALLPNFKLDFSAKTIVRFFPRQNNRYKDVKDSDKVLFVEKLWKAQLENYQKEYEHLLISLTGGNDSRISLALSKKYKESLKYFTYTKNPEEIDNKIKREVVNDKDRQIVEQILEDNVINHEFIFYNDDDLEISKKLKYTLAKNSIINHGRFLLNLYLKHFPYNDNMHLRGTCLEIVQSVYVNPRVDSNNKKGVLDRYLFSAEKYYSLLPKEEFEKIGKLGIEKLEYDKSHFDFHVLDLYYWEHRMGRWHPELLNETDVAFDTFLPFNLRAILEIGIAFSIDKRQSGYLFKELINNNYSILNFYGVNNTKNMYEQNKKIAQHNSSSEVENRKIYLSNFSLYNKNDDKIIDQQSDDNKIKLPVEHLLDGNYAKSDYTVTGDDVVLELSLTSLYMNNNAENILKYEVLINDSVILEEDISKWNLPNVINIFDVSKNDILSIKVKALKTVPRPSWERASTVTVNSIREYPMEPKNGQQPKVLCTSPYSLIKNH